MNFCPPTHFDPSSRCVDSHIKLKAAQIKPENFETEFGQDKQGLELICCAACPRQA